MLVADVAWLDGAPVVESPSSGKVVRGLIVGEPYSPRPDRLRYELTAEGRALVDALAGLAAWGAEHGPGDGDDLALRHEACGGPLQARWYCPTCDVEVAPGDDTGVFQA